MHLISSIEKQVVNFFKINDWINMVETGNFSALTTLSGFIIHLEPLIPIFVIIEAVHSYFHGNLNLKNYKFSVFTQLVNLLISRILSLGVIIFSIAWSSKFQFYKINFSWYSVIYGFIIFELAEYIHHFISHKVRILWCIHSIHHIPEDMNISVRYTTSFLESPLADLIRIPICIVSGMNPLSIFFIMTVHTLWSGFIHTGDGLIKSGRLGVLKFLIITPSLHRVHHAKNSLYLDTNFSNFLNIWDRLFGTYQSERADIKPEYGTTRKQHSSNIMNVYIGEIYALMVDVWNAPGIINKIKYIFMPPGWNHSGKTNTAKFIRSEFIETDHIRRDKE